MVEVAPGDAVPAPPARGEVPDLRPRTSTVRVVLLLGLTAAAAALAYWLSIR
jgi:hypothetical protein